MGSDNELRGKSVLKIIGVALLLISGLVVVYFLKPGQSFIYPPCPVYFLTGLYCPGCGTLRGIHALLHGQFLHALDLNPLMVISIPFLGYAIISQALFYIRGKGLPQVIKHPIWIWAIFVLIIVYTILRNIPFYPFNILAP